MIGINNQFMYTKRRIILNITFIIKIIGTAKHHVRQFQVASKAWLFLTSPPGGRSPANMPALVLVVHITSTRCHVRTLSCRPSFPKHSSLTIGKTGYNSRSLNAELVSTVFNLVIFKLSWIKCYSHDVVTMLLEIYGLLHTTCYSHIGNGVKFGLVA